MKSTALPLPAKAREKSTVPIFKILFAKRSVFFFTCLLLAGLSFLSARCNILTYCSPFALALACAAPSEFMPAAVIGGAAGYLTAGYEIVPVRYLAALIIAVVMKRLFSEKTRNNPLFCGITALFCTAASGIVTSLLLDEVQVTLIPYTAESFIAAAAAVFWAGSVGHLRSMKSLSALKESETACLLISVFLIILSLSYIHIYSLSLAKILAFFTILISAYYGKMSAGSLAGIGGGVALGFGGGDMAAFAGLSVGGLFAGLGASHSKLLSVIALEAGNAVPLLFGISKAVDYSPFIEAGIAGIIFLLFPKKVLDRFHFLNAQSYSVSASGVKSHTVSRLRFASDALSDVSANIYEFKDKVNEAYPAKKTMIYMNTMQKTCEKCGLKYYCWERKKERTVAVFKQIEKMLEHEQELTPQTLPDNFGEECIRAKVLIKHFTGEHTAYMANRLASARAQSMREVMSVQFDALAQLLFDLSADIEQKEIMDTELTDNLLELLDYCEADYLSASVLTDRNFRIKVNIKIPYRQEVLEKSAFLDDLSDICARRFEPALLTEYEQGFKLSFFEKALYHCDCGQYQISAQGNRYCGDALELIRDYEGKSAAIIADGMGNGFPAHLNASLSADMLAKLIASGFSVGAAIKIINAALIVKDSDESFSSLDLALFDRYSGKTDFYKAGATCSVVIRNEKVSQVALSSMPVGILGQADFAHTSLTLGDGDVLLLVSDGATQGDSEWIGALAMQGEYADARALAKLVAETAHAANRGAHEDDISVIAMLISSDEQRA